MKKLSNSLIKQQNGKREQTIIKVEKAIAELKSEGFNLSIKLISERSKLSRSVFSKPHVKKILQEQKMREIAVPKEKSSNQIIKQRENDKDELIKKLKNELSLKGTECELLRGRLHILMQNCRIKGINIM